MNKFKRFLNIPWLIITGLITLIVTKAELGLGLSALLILTIVFAYLAGMWDGTPQNMKDAIKSKPGEWDWKLMKPKSRT